MKKKYDLYVIAYESDNKTNLLTVVGAKSAISLYRAYQEIYGDSTRLLKVILNYGEKI